MFQIDQPQRQLPTEPEKRTEEELVPKKPEVTKPEGGNELLRRLRNIDPDQAKKYRQRSGQ